MDHRYPLPPLHIRPASVREGAPYLQGHPRFSECTVPIVWYPFERLNNFAHLFRWAQWEAAGAGRGNGRTMHPLNCRAAETPVRKRAELGCRQGRSTEHGHAAAPACLCVCRDNGARLLGAVQETPWAQQHGKLVLMTAEVRFVCFAWHPELPRRPRHRLPRHCIVCSWV